MRALAAIAVLVAACDFRSGHSRGTPDARPASGDGGESCATWTLEPSTAASLALMDQPPYDTSRSLRVAVTTSLGECAMRAMPRVEIDAGSLTATIELSVWRQTEGSCAPAEGGIMRPVVLSLPVVGTWTIVADGAEPLSVKVEAGVGGQCGVGGSECRRDCDCDSGEVCLRGTGVGGPFSACVRSCELDRDCSGAGVCVDVADGLNRICADGDECNQSGEATCPAGYSCDLDTDSCTPEFTLGEQARGPCTCDSDCAAGLHCVLGEDSGHCEVTCPTSGPWCEGAHVCGNADDDAAGLATTDSVCIWLGE